MSMQAVKCNGVTYVCIRDAAKALGVDVECLRKELRKPRHKRALKIERTNIPLVPYTDTGITLPMTYEIDGQFFPSTNAAAKYLGIHPGTLRQAVREGRTWTFSGKRFKYLGRGAQSNSKPVICLTTGKRYSSASAAAKDCYLPQQSIAWCANTGKERGGLTFAWDK